MDISDTDCIQLPTEYLISCFQVKILQSYFKFQVLGFTYPGNP